MLKLVLREMVDAQLTTSKIKKTYIGFLNVQVEKLLSQLGSSFVETQSYNSQGSVSHFTYEGYEYEVTIRPIKEVSENNEE